MPVTEVTATFPHASGVPEDQVQNRFHIEHTSAQLDEADAADVALALANFYAQDTGGANTAIAAYYSNDINLAAAEYRFRVAGAPAPNPPYAVIPLGTNHVRIDANDLPEENAVVMSFRGFPEAGVPGARRRNRIYLGPFNLAAVQQGAIRTAVAPALIDVIGDAATRLHNDVAAINVANGVSWVGVSRWPYGPPVPPNKSPVPGPVTSFDLDEGWVDNAWDTQRRRGRDALTRTTFELTL